LGNGSRITTGIQHVKYGADVNAHDKFGASAPNTASDLGRFDIVARFLDKGFSYNLEKLAKAVQSRPVPPNSDAQGWKDLVNQMANNGANATDAEFDTIAKYLAASFPAK